MLKIESPTLPESLARSDTLSDKAKNALCQRYSVAIRKALKLNEDQCWFLSQLFDAGFYQQISSVSSSDPVSLLKHYLTQGMQNNFNPSPYFDTDYVAKAMNLNEYAIVEDVDVDESVEVKEPDNVMLVWLTDGFDSIKAIDWFDEEFYRCTYPDIDEAVVNAYRHFATRGYLENRMPCPAILRIADAMLTHFPQYPTSVAALVASVPAAGVNTLFNDDALNTLCEHFMPPIYSVVLEFSEQPDQWTMFCHYLTVGWTVGLRPTALFNEKWYRSSVKSNADIAPIDNSNPYLHWYFVGRAEQIDPTPLFDAQHYIEVNPDLRAAYSDIPFEHYLQHGIKEHGRSISAYFNANFYRQAAAPMSNPSPIQDYLTRGQFIGKLPAEGLVDSAFPCSTPWASSPAEEAAIVIRSKIERLNRGKLRELFAQIEELEPQVVRPYGRTKVRMPPLLHPEATLTTRASDMLDALPATQYDSVILIPHCRMAGSAKVSGALTNALANVTNTGKVLLVTTDMSVFERSSWFPEGVEIFNFHEHMQGLEQDLRVRALLDLVRGLRPRRLVNINSNLGWHLTKHYGRQLSEWMHIYFYLFCWDLDFKGNKGGYPIQWFLPSFDYCSGVFTDDLSLRDELINRYAPSRVLAERIVTLYEPAVETEVNYRAALSERAMHKGMRRVFWCGRFDRQKRMDILVKVAALMPDVEFQVWGKPVLADSKNYLRDATPNIRVMGAYECIDDVPIASCDCYLYTSAWDGMPSVLIEMSTRNLPIVASNVGGVGELITPETGWPINDIEDVDAYVAAVREAIENPDMALRKSTKLRQHTLELCTHERYEDTIRQVIGKEHSRSDNDRLVYADAVEKHVRVNQSNTSDITAVLTAHSEGAVAAVSYTNFLQSCSNAEANGISVEKIVVLDRADNATRRVFEDATQAIRVIETDYGDQGAVRNYAAQCASGEYIAFIDGDDLWSQNWLCEAHAFMQRSPTNVIAHPEFCRFFGGTSSTYVNIDQESPEFRKDFMRHANYWDAMCFARRQTHLDFPYCKRRIRDGFAFEDWHWNCETVEGGMVHKVVNDTLHFKRRRESSQTSQAASNRSLMPTTQLTDFAFQCGVSTANTTIEQSPQRNSSDMDEAA